MRRSRGWLGWSLLALIALAGSGCMISPQNGQEVCGANASVTFSGYIPWGNRDVVIQQSSSPTSGWTNVGTVKSQSNAYTIEGINYHYFSKAFQLTKWTSIAAGGAEQHVFVRARVQNDLGTGPYWTTLTTFDVELPLGSTPLSCLQQRMSQGYTGQQALSYCDSGESPVVELIAPALSTCGGCSNTVVNGNVTIDSALSATQYVCTQTINGNVTVTENAPEVVPLPALTSISGNVTFDYGYPFQQFGQTIYRRRMIDLPVLTTIGGDVALDARRNDGPKPSPNGLDAVTSVGGDITITLYDANPNVFGALTSHTGNITIQGYVNGQLDVNASGSFEALTHVTGDVLVQRFFATNNMFDHLQTVTGNVTVGTLRFYPDQSFDDLQTVSGNLHFVAMKEHGPTWPSLQSVGGELGFMQQATTTGLSYIPVPAISTNALRIENNAMLNSLSGTSFHVGAGNIVISGNPALSQCEVDAFLAAQQAAGWTGTATVSGTLACSR